MQFMGKCFGENNTLFRAKYRVYEHTLNTLLPISIALQND